MTLSSMSSRSSVDRAPARCSGGHGFDSCRGLRNFSLSHARVMLINSSFTSSLMLLEKQGKRNGESTHLPTVWPGFDFYTRCHMCVEFVIGSRLAPKVFLRHLWFFSLHETNISKFQFDQDRGTDVAFLAKYSIFFFLSEMCMK